MKLGTLVFNDGTQIDVPDAGVVLVVGPNNSGKSQTLRDILTLTSSLGADPKGVVLTSASVTKIGSTDEFMEHVEAIAPPRKTQDGPVYIFPSTGRYDRTGAASFWTSYDRLQYVGAYFVLLANAGSRLDASKSVPNIDSESGEMATLPAQLAYRNPATELELDAISLEAFGVHAVLDRYTGGSVLRFRVGDRPNVEFISGVPSQAFIDKIREIPLLEDQGDGVKSFLGLMLQLIAGHQRILLVDEPEAFLHPPQARLLGSMLAKRAKDGRQVVAASHSSDVVLGALESGAPVSIVRLSRDGDVNRASVLDHSALNELWSDPLLRYSNLLDGLFHDAVVLCEGDGDCRFYSSVIDSILDQRDEVAGERRRRPEILYTHCNGKGGMAKVARALRAAGISVMALPDFDILQFDRDLKPLVEALGGDFATITPDLRALQMYLTVSEDPEKREVAARLEIALADVPDGKVTSKQIEKLTDGLKTKTRWATVKKTGLGGLPPGPANQAAVALLGNLKAIGVHVVPNGEMESFIKCVNEHAYSWLNEVFEKRLHADRTNAELRNYLSEVIAAID